MGQAGYDKKVPYGYVNQTLAHVASAKYYLLDYLKSIHWKFEAIIFNIDKYMEV